MYFTIITITTVGYGDISPVTTIGRLVSVLTVLAGVTLIPWQLGKLLKVVLSSNTKKKVKCTKCGLEDHDNDAIHCKACGTIIKQKHEEE
ncbi:TPA: two pore domain potassium channel family protein [Candidatus Woesearchaeota archaeon]|nr:two pore domain potassium channel family protein [Candidatus Woesearchaeota archaeon]